MVKNKTNISPVLFIVIFVVILVVVGGYFLFLKSSGSIAIPFINSAPQATEKDFEFVKDPLIKKHFVAQANQTSFRTKNLSSGRGEDTMTTEMEIKGNGFNLRTITEDKTGKEISHMINISDTTYVKDYKDGKWWKEVAKPIPTEIQKSQEELFPTPESFKDELLEKTEVTYKQLGTENCGQSAPDLTCYKYQEIDPDNKESERIFWFDNSKFLLRKEEMGFGEFKSTNEYSYININITDPSPTKEVPTGKSIYEMLFTETNTVIDNTNLQFDQQELQGSQNGTQDIPTDTNYEEPQDDSSYSE